MGQLADPGQPGSAGPNRHWQCWALAAAARPLARRRPRRTPAVTMTAALPCAAQLGHSVLAEQDSLTGVTVTAVSTRRPRYLLLPKQPTRIRVARVTVLGENRGL